MQDGELLGGRLARELVHLVGAVVGEVEDGALAGSVEADLGIRGGFADLLAGGELGVLVGNVPAAVVPMRDDGVGGGVEVALAADVQPGVAVHIDELGAEDALAVVVIEDVPRHEQLEELVAARADGADLGDAVSVAEHGAQAGDAALDLRLDEQVGAADAPLGAGVLALGVGDVVHHHGHRAAVGAAPDAGEKVGVVVGQGGGAGFRLFDLRQRGGGHLAGCLGRGRRSGRFAFPQQAFEQAGQSAAQRGAARRRAAGQSQRCRCQTGNMKDGPTRDLHNKTASYQKAPPHTGRAVRSVLIVLVCAPFVKRELPPEHRAGPESFL